MAQEDALADAAGTVDEEQGHGAVGGIVVERGSEHVELGGATDEGPVAQCAETLGFFRRPYGPGWALVGDAGYHERHHRRPIARIGSVRVALGGRRPAGSRIRGG